MEDFHVLECPNCGGGVIVHKNELNCCIFRHGTYKSSGEPINPHAPETECTRLLDSGVIEGCGKPFRAITVDGKVVLEVCGYL